MSLLSHLRRALGKSGNTASAECVEIPVLDLSEGPVYAVGDAHGCLSLYRQLEAQILRDAAALPGTPTVVLLGDIVDKGPDTAALLDFLLRPAPPPLRRLCLRGNHESMMLAYLEKPAKNAQWLGFGGVETLLSYGLALDADALQTNARAEIAPDPDRAYSGHPSWVSAPHITRIAGRPVSAGPCWGRRQRPRLRHNLGARC